MSAQAQSPARFIYLAASKLRDPVARTEYLDEACGSDPKLRKQLDRLLGADEDDADSPLQAAIEELGHDSREEPVRLGINGSVASCDASTDPNQVDATVDARIDVSQHPVIGRYKLLEELGSGGMGAVYMAQQTAPVKRKVALKIIKPGMDSREVIARFQAERQALAMMDHPNIARVLDAGTTDEGRPYFVMELVRGIPITKFCEQKKLGLRDRLTLFIDVCKAVQHAHQKAIIHRDLKPSNILVTLHDGEPVVKVIDFGVAKALNQELTEQTLFTQFSQMIGTPLYMSPEQAEMSGLDVDTRSDVYSLGVVLYELLTGTTPIERESLASLGYDAVRKLVMEQEPERPSSRISTLKAGTDSSVTEHRNHATTILAKQLRSELDWIVMKALEKDRTRRYETTNGMAADVQRYIDGKAVEACPPSLAYRLRRFAGRNRAAFTSAVLIAGVVIVGIFGTGWQAIRAMRSEQDAQRNKKLAEKNLEIAEQNLERADSNLKRATQAINDYLADVATNTDLMAPGLAPLRKTLLSRALEFNQELMEENPNDLDLKQELAMNYFSLAVADLISTEESIQYAEQSRQILKEVLASKPSDTITTRRLAFTEAFLGDRERKAGRIDQALQIHRASRATLERLLENHPANESIGVTQRYLATSIMEIARDLDAKGDRQGAVVEAGQAFELYRDLVDNWAEGSDHRLSTYFNGLMQAAGFLVDIHLGMNNLEPAIEINREARELLEESYGEIPEDPMKLKLLTDMIAGRAAIATRMHDFQVAVKFQRKELERRQTLAERNPGVVKYEADLARAYTNMNYRLGLAGLPRVKDYSLRSIEIRTRLWEETGNHSHLSGLATALRNFASDLEYHGEINQAREKLKQALDYTTQVRDRFPDDPGYTFSVALSCQALAGLYGRLGEFELAMQLQLRAMDQFDQAAKQDGETFQNRLFAASAARFYADILFDSGKRHEALGYYQQAVDETRPLQHETHGAWSTFQSALARLCRARKLAEVDANSNSVDWQSIVTAANQRDASILSDDDFVTLGQALFYLGDYRGAIAALEQAAGKGMEIDSPRQPGAWFRVMALAQIGQSDIAQESFRNLSAILEENYAGHDYCGFQQEAASTLAQHPD